MEAEVVVIGAGLVGTATARHLAEQGADVVLIGAPSGGPPFSSHDDDTRITRVLDASPVWAELARRSIDAYGDLERRSGIRFHHPVGVLWLAAEEGGLSSMDPVSEQFGVDVRRDAASPWAQDLELPSTDVAILESGGAGFIEPRRMLESQATLARRAGAQRIEGVAIGVDEAPGGWRVRLEDGGSATGRRVVAAAGASTGFLLGVDVSVTAEAVLLVEVGPGIGRSWARRPVIGRLDGGVVDVYLTPPHRVAGRWVMKVGVESAEDAILETKREVGDWMSGDGIEERRRRLESTVARIFPGLDPVSTDVRPCIYARTPRRLPLVQEIEPGLFVAGGGNGRAAKSSDAIGAIAARLVTTGKWDDPLSPGDLEG